MHRAIFRVLALLRIFKSRMRAHSLSLSGARIAGKCLLAERVRVDRPWQVGIGKRVQLEADVWLKLVSAQATIEIGDYVFMGRGTEIDASLAVAIGSHVLIAPGVFITDHGHNIDAGPRIDAQGCHAAPVIIEDEVWLGTHCVVLPGVRIGRGAVVGAGAVVTKDVLPYAVVAGVPARLLRMR